MHSRYGRSDPDLVELTGTIRINGQETSVTMILDDDSVGQELKSQLISKFEWTEVEESESFRSLNIEKW